MAPENFKSMLVKMEQDDWLYNYRENWGIKFSIQNVLNKAKYLDKDIPVFEAFLNNKAFLQECYNDFFRIYWLMQKGLIPFFSWKIKTAYKGNGSDRLIFHSSCLRLQ